MSLAQLLLVIRARRRLIFLAMLFTVAAVMLASLAIPKTYKATASLVLNYKGVDPVTGQGVPGQIAQSYVATQIDVIKSQGVALRVVRDLKLSEDPKVREQFAKATNGTGNIDDWLAERLVKRMEVVPTRDSSVVDVVVKAPSAVEAAAIANGFAAAYQATSLQLKVDPVKNATLYFNDQIKALRANLEAAQNKVSAFQQESGISNAEGRYDVESIRLNDLSTQLVTVQGQLMDALSRQRQGQGAGAAESPDVLASPLIQTLKGSVAQAEARFASIKERFNQDHPQYLQAKAELDRLRAELNTNIKATTGGIANNARILQRREAELREAVAAQKTKVLELNRARDQLAMLNKETDSARHAYDTAIQRVTQTQLESQFNRSDAAILTAAVPPFRHAFPLLKLNLALALAGGTLLGLGLALLAELRDRRVRSAIDLADALQAPVLGSIDWSRTGPDTKRLPNLISPRLLPQ